MGKFMDFMDDFVFGPLNLITRVEGLVKQQIYQDTSVKFSILRVDKGGTHTQNDVTRILTRYNIPTFGWTHDSQCFHFLIKRRQANWAEYLLLLGGIQLENPLVNPKNLEYIKRHPPGWMPPAWADQPRNDDTEGEIEYVEIETDEQSEIAKRKPPLITASPLSRIINWLDSI